MKKELKKNRINGLTNVLEYERALTRHESKKRLYMSGWTEADAKRFERMDIKVDTIQRLNAEADAEAEAIIHEYNTCAEWLAEADAEAIQKPVDCSLWHFCRKQKTRESTDIIEFTDCGLRKDGQFYDDYKQEILMHLYEIAIENPNDNFAETLFLATKKGIYSEWRKYHHLTRNADGKIIERKNIDIDKPLDKDNSESASLKDALPDTLAKPLDFDIIQNEKCNDILKHCKGNEARYIADIANGYSVKEIAYYDGLNYDTIQKSIYRAKKRIGKALHAESEIKSMIAETEAREAEAKRKSLEPAEPASYHRTEARQAIKCEYNYTDVKTIKRMLDKPEHKPLYAEYTDNEQLLKRIAERDMLNAEIADYEKRMQALNAR